MAEQAKADGTSVAEFMEKFNAKAYEILSKGEYATEGQKSLADEAKESAELDSGVKPTTVEKPAEKSAIEKGKELADKVNARIEKEA